jgi:hypothetical protein
VLGTQPLGRPHAAARLGVEAASRCRSGQEGIWVWYIDLDQEPGPRRPLCGWPGLLVKINTPHPDPFLAAAAASACRFYPQPRRGMWSSQRLCAHHDSSLRSSLLRYRSEWTPRSSSPSSNAMLNLSTPWVDSVPLGFDSPASSPGDSTEIANGEENRGGNWGPSGHLPTTTSSPASSRLAGFPRRRAREAARRAPLLPPQLRRSFLKR